MTNAEENLRAWKDRNNKHNQATNNNNKQPVNLSEEKLYRNYAAQDHNNKYVTTNCNRICHPNSEPLVRNFGSQLITQKADTMEEDVDNYGDEDSTELLSEALLAVASAEEYAAKIIRLQQACLTPLKEDLADWLNKIMNMSTITRENFMKKLDNGAIICRLAKIISHWCEQQLNDSQPTKQLPQTQQASNITTNTINGTSMSYQFRNNLTRMEQTKIWEDAKSKTFYSRDNVCNFLRWCKEFGVNQSVLFESDDLVLHANTRQVVLCLLDVARIACVRFGFTEAPGLVKFEQEIDRKLAAEKAANLEHNNLEHIKRHNSMVRTSEELISSTSSACDKSANRSLLMELVEQHHQSMDNQEAGHDHHDSNHLHSATSKKLSSLARGSRVNPLADATDDLIMRYCLHKEGEAAKKRAAQLEEEAKAVVDKKQEEEQQQQQQMELQRHEQLEQDTGRDYGKLVAELAIVTDDEQPSEDSIDGIPPLDNCEPDSTEPELSKQNLDGAYSQVEQAAEEAQLNLGGEDDVAREQQIEFADSLDSGEGRTESGSKSTSCTPLTSCSSTTKTGLAKTAPAKPSSIPLPIKRSSSSSSLISQQSSSLGSSEDLVATASSLSRSSLLSGQDSSGRKQRHIASDLDGKVMRIAKSYYGKAATKGVTRLSEGKYRIADRIVFVRLLKGHRVMVRIGGGWDTLENFLFRHKSDPSQVIDVNNLLPLETKLSLDNKASPQLTPNSALSNGHLTNGQSPGNRFSKLPYYRRTSSASSTNLSTSMNSEYSHHSPKSRLPLKSGVATTTIIRWKSTTKIQPALAKKI